jgi:hypothetical protein
MKENEISRFPGVLVIPLSESRKQAESKSGTWWRHLSTSLLEQKTAGFRISRRIQHFLN